MVLLSCSGQFVDGAFLDHFASEVQKDGEELLQTHAAWLGTIQCYHVQIELFLQVGVLVKSVEDDIYVCVLFEFYDHPYPASIGFVPDVADAFDDAFVDDFRDLLHQQRLVCLVGHLADDECSFGAASGCDLLFQIDDPTHGHGTVSCGVGVSQPLRIEQEPPGREVWCRYVLHETSEGDLWVLDECQQGIGDFGDVVRWDGGGHSDRDATAPVDQQLRQFCGKYGGFHVGAVEVLCELHGLASQVIQHGFVGKLGQPALGVSHGCGGITIQGSEVSVSIHEGFVEAETLRQSHECIVHGGIAVWMELSQHFSDDSRTLSEGFVGRKSEFVHGEEDPPVHGFESVPRIRQRSSHDHRHGVREVGSRHFLPQLLFDLTRRHAVSIARGRSRGRVSPSLSVQAHLSRPFPPLQSDPPPYGGAHRRRRGAHVHGPRRSHDHVWSVGVRKGWRRGTRPGSKGIRSNTSPFQTRTGWRERGSNPQGQVPIHGGGDPKDNTNQETCRPVESGAIKLGGHGDGGSNGSRDEKSQTTTTHTIDCGACTRKSSTYGQSTASYDAVVGHRGVPAA
eukprot:scaffold826_cov335-Pavlova_lutheri.AAC.11